MSELSRLEFETSVRACGGSCHIPIPRKLIGKRVKVTVEVVHETTTD